MNASSHLSGILRGGASIIFIQVAGAGASFMGSVVLARELGPYEYGRLAFGLALLSLLPQLSPLGLNSALVKLIPLYAMREQYNRIRQLVVWSTCVVLFAGIMVAAIGTAAAMATSVNGRSTYMWPAIISMGATPFIAVVTLNLDVCRTQGYIAAGFIPRCFIIPVLPAFILLIGADQVTAILAGITMLCCLLAGGQTWYIWRRMPAFRLVRNRLNGTATPSVKLWRGWMRLALSMFVGTAANCVLNGAHTVVVGMFMDPVAVGAFQVSARTASLVSMPLFAANALAAPVIVRFSDKTEKANLGRMISFLTHLLFWPAAMLLAVFACYGRSILSVFDAAYAATGYAALLVLSLAQLISVGTGLVASLLTMTGHHDVCAAVYTGAAISNVVLLCILVPSYGVAGAAAATAIPILICNVTLCVIVRRRLGINAHIFAAPTTRCN